MDPYQSSLINQLVGYKWSCACGPTCQVDLKFLLKMRYDPFYLASAAVSVATTIVCISFMSNNISQGLDIKLR
jgi:hypothetical protein